MQPSAFRIPDWLILVYVLSLLPVLAWPLILLGYGMLLLVALPGSFTPADTPVIAIALGYPLIPVIAVLGSCFAWRAKRERLAYAMAAIASLEFIGLVAAFGGLVIKTILSLLGLRL